MLKDRKIRDVPNLPNWKNIILLYEPKFENLIYDLVVVSISIVKQAKLGVLDLYKMTRIANRMTKQPLNAGISDLMSDCLFIQAFCIHVRINYERRTISVWLQVRVYNKIRPLPTESSLIFGCTITIWKFLIIREKWHYFLDIINDKDIRLWDIPATNFMDFWDNL